MPRATLHPVSRTSLSDGIVEQIIDLITRGMLRPGDRIPSEHQLCRQLGVGRTSVREALKSLVVMGILTTYPGHGTFVSEDSSRCVEKALQWGLLLDQKMVGDLVETRLMLECQTASLAAKKASASDLREIGETIDGMENTVFAPDQYLEFDLRFHLAVARATQNSILQQLLRMIRGYLQTWIKETLTNSPDRGIARAELSIQEHRRVLLALESHDSEEALRAMRSHILSSSSDLRPRTTTM